MSKLYKLRLSFILLIIGIGLIPTAFLAKGYFRDQVPANASEVLLTLKNEGISYIEQEYKGLCIPEVLPRMVEEELIDLETDVAKVRHIPQFLRFIKNETINGFSPIINGSKAAKEINGVIGLVQVQNSTSFANASDYFFNNYEFQDNYSTPIEGVSERMMGSVSLNYSDIAQTRLLNGFTYDSTVYPGLTTNLNFGFGVNNWLEFYSLAESDPGNRSLMENVYNCTWSSGQLQNLSAYIKSYLWNTLVKNYYDLKGITNPAEFEFYAQWANLSFYNDYINLNDFSDLINQTLTRYEAGTSLGGIIITPTGISFTSAKDLWDPTNPSSFVNDTGFLNWANATTDIKFELSNNFSITSNQVDKILTWLFDPVKNTIVPNLIKYPEPIGLGMNTTVYAEVLFYEQWANGTVIEDGLELREGYKGIEACIVYNKTSMEVLYITKTNISLEIVQALFDKANTSSLTNRFGIVTWIKAAEGDSIAQNELISTFNLTVDQINLTNGWLFSTLRYDIIPNIIKRYPLDLCNLKNIDSMPEFAEIEFYRQWANGSSIPEGIDIAPFLSLESSTKNFEIGIPIPSNLNCTQSKSLWDEKSYYSFVNRKGISIWYEAKLGSSNHYNALKFSSNFNLTDSDMNTVLNWLVYIRDNVTLRYTQIKEDLPVNYYELADLYYIGIMIGAIGFSSVGLIFGVIVSIYHKKR